MARKNMILGLGGIQLKSLLMLGMPKRSHWLLEQQTMALFVEARRHCYMRSGMRPGMLL
jgi:hypothetical protein